MSALAQRGIAQGRPMALAVTIGLHVALVAGLLAIKVAEAVKDYAIPIQVRNIDPEHKPIPVAKPILPVLGRPQALAQPDPDLRDLVFDETSTAIDVDRSQEVVVGETTTTIESGPLLPDTPLRYQAVRSTDDYYPPQAIRMAAEGAAIVRACVDAAGRLSTAPTVVKSSRESLLDAAAVRWAGEALRFQPATRNGAAVAACKDFRVSFTLH